MRVSAGLMIGGSAVATAATVLNAFVINKQFYPSIVYLSKSNASMAVIYVQGLVFIYLIFQLLKSIFFGDLRAAEAEHLSERTWHAVLETCLAFTVFRDDFSAIFVLQFVGLLFIKSFHWLADDRVDMMERSPVITLRFHLRMMAVLAALGFADSYFVSSAYFTTMTRGASSQIVFGFEYAILLAMVLHVTIKYLLHMHDLRNPHSWDNKAVYLLYAELFINLIRCVLYGFFAVIMLRVHTFPLFSVRPFYQSVRALHKAFLDVLLSRRAIHAMNSQFANVTAEELAAMDATCIICREEMTADSSPKRLPCSHVFHTHCLRSWFQRQQTCPTCRTDILGNNAANQQQQAQQAAAAVADAARAVFADPAQPAQAAPPFIPFLGHQFGAGGQNRQFPHQIFYAPAPANRPEFQNFGGLQVNGGPPAMFPMMPPPPPPGGLQGPAPDAAQAQPAAPIGPHFVLTPSEPASANPRLPNLSELSTEDLRLLEGDTREAILARLEAMDNILVLLESAQMQMIQLASVTPARILVRGRPDTAPDSPIPTVPMDSEIEVVPLREDVERLQQQQESSSSSTQPEEPTPAPSLFGNSSNSNIAASPTTSSPTGRTPEAEEVRQRRLARLLGETPPSN